MLHLDFRDGKPVSQQIADGIRQQISSGILRAGEQLPSVRDLSVELSVNPGHIQRAYDRLEMEGWIAAVDGSGVFVRGGGESDLQREKRLLQTFSAVADQLMQRGYTRQDLIDRLNREDAYD